MNWREWREAIVACFNKKIICLEELKKSTQNLSQDNHSQGRDLNPGPSDYEGGVLGRDVR
jgi:hypothetical protein